MTDSDSVSTTIDCGQLAAAELGERLQLLAALLEHPRTNHSMIQVCKLEAQQLLEAIGARVVSA